MFLRYNPSTGQYDLPSKAEVLTWEDMEGKFPCEKCWEDAREFGVQVWPYRDDAKLEFVRCECGRLLDVKKAS